MKTKTASEFVITALLIVATHDGRSQSSFVDLDFESPIQPLVADAFYLVPSSKAIPGWKAYVGSDARDQIVFNQVTLESPAVSLHGPESFLSSLQGNYSVLLQGQYKGSGIAASIAQTGQIPTESLTVIFDLFTYSNIELSFAGHAIPLVQIGSEPGYNIVAGDISAFAGVTGELRFTALGNKDGLIDDIRFSSEPIVVPEPGTISLFALGAFALVGRFALRKRDP